MTQTERQSHDQQEAAEALRKKLRSGETSGIPSGGSTGQILKKMSDEDGDVAWVDDQSYLPNGWSGDGLTPESIDTNGGGIRTSGAPITLGAGDLLSTGVVAGSNITASNALALGTFPTTNIKRGSADPTVSPGVTLAIGGLYLRTNGELWVKTTSPATGWQRVAFV